MSVDFASLIGKRNSNEDKHHITLNKTGADKNMAKINLFMVADGHGGRYVSKYISEQLPKLFLDPRLNYPLKKAFANTSFSYFQEILKKNHARYATETGSTCLTVIHYEKNGAEYLNILNVGDSRCILCRNNIGISLTYDHKPGNFSEKARITKLGGEVYFDGYDFRIKDLSVSRAFGDISATPYVTCEPDLFKYSIMPEDKFIVIACDGLWDVFDEQFVVNFILLECYNLSTSERKTDKIAKKLAEKAIEKGSTDNISVIVVFFK